MNRRLKISAWAMALIFAAALVHSTVVSITSVTPRIIDIENLPVIIIDPGHGGIDGGAVGAGDVLEKDINLAISLLLRDMLTITGFEVVMTREDDRSIHDEDVTGVRRQKRSDLHNRLEIAEAHYPNVIFLSIHQNRFQDASSRGAQIFHSPNHADSERLARILQDTIIEMVQPDNTRDIKKAGDNLFLMDRMQCPAVLIECGFLSNIQDTKELTDPEYQKRLAFAIFVSVLRYLELDMPTGVREAV